MSERLIKLLPRLITALDTLSDPGDIANTVRRIRTLLGPKAFSTRMLDTKPAVARIELRDLPRASVMRLRSLGFFLRRYGHSNPLVDAALARVREALIEQTSLGAEDVLVVLLLMREIAEANGGGQVTHLPFPALAAVGLQAELMNSVALLFRYLNR